MTPVASIVIPAHNEERVIARTLRRVLATARPGELHVVVVCNGCDDETARVARETAPDADVIEITVASKIAALNTGDGRSQHFPRVYLDADVEVTTDDLRAVCRPLADGDVLAASCGVRADVSKASMIVRSYVAMWSRLPEVREGLSGRGLYALSREGRTRFESFPAVTADDRFVNELFASHERRIVEDAATVVRPPSTLRALVRRRVRVVRGNREVPRAPDRPRTTWQWIEVVRAEPRMVIHAPAFVGVSLAARLLARLKRGGGVSWDQDRTTR